MIEVCSELNTSLFKMLLGCVVEILMDGEIERKAAIPGGEFNDKAVSGLWRKLKAGIGFTRWKPKSDGVDGSKIFKRGAKHDVE